jgi:hypothetical protein
MGALHLAERFTSCHGFVPSITDPLPEEESYLIWLNGSIFP